VPNPFARVEEGEKFRPKRLSEVHPPSAAYPPTDHDYDTISSVGPQAEDYDSENDLASEESLTLNLAPRRPLVGRLQHSYRENIGRSHNFPSQYRSNTDGYGPDQVQYGPREPRNRERRFR
jgi:hypothetical protein